MNRRVALQSLIAVPAFARPCRLPMLPPYPVPVAGQFVGVHRGRIIVAGGTIWTKPKWEGGEKRWTTAIYTLGPRETSWRKSGEQPEPLAYGGAVSTPAGLVCIGGQSPTTASAAVGLLYWDGSQVRQRPMADLPNPLMLLGAAMSGQSILVVGGQAGPASTEASGKVWQLPPNGRKWESAPPLPGPGRILPVVAGGRDGIFAASGASLSADSSGKPVRSYLRDAFRFRSEAGWMALPELPSPVLAAPSYCDSAGNFVVLGGDDGAHAGEIPDPGPRHPGFSRAILRFDQGDWRAIGKLPEGQVTTGVALWQGLAVVPSGENLPGTRTTRVLSNPIRARIAPCAL